MKEIARTKRLVLREASLDDAEFVLELINDPGWLKYISQHSIDTLEKAKEYIEERLLSAYNHALLQLHFRYRPTDLDFSRRLSKCELNCQNLAVAHVRHCRGRCGAKCSAVYCRSISVWVLQSSRTVKRWIPQHCLQTQLDPAFVCNV